MARRQASKGLPSKGEKQNEKPFIGKTPMFPPCPCLQYGRYLDKLGSQKRAPRYTFSRSESDSGLAAKTAAQNIQPGQYKADRDFVSDTTREVSKNVDARFRKSPGWTFGDDARMDDAGVLKGVRNPGNIKMWINPLGPGQYPAVDGMEQAAKVHLTSSPAWTQRKGQPAETIRATKAAGCAPGPGYYAPETKVEKPGRHRVCRNAGQFSLIFSRIVTSPTLPRCKSETASACSSRERASERLAEVS